MFTVLHPVISLGTGEQSQREETRESVKCRQCTVRCQQYNKGGNHAVAVKTSNQPQGEPDAAGGRGREYGLEERTRNAHRGATALLSSQPFHDNKHASVYSSCIKRGNSRPKRGLPENKGTALASNQTRSNCAHVPACLA